MPEPNPLYRPITPYQTRILCLRGDHGAPDSLPVCDLYVADILHPKYEGLGVRSLNGENDDIKEYEALSYFWGSEGKAEVIVCNSVKFPISRTLFEAFRTLRKSQTQVRYLWVDAICINQSDDEEKSKQVWNMLQIYEKATRVIAWLGNAPSDMDNVLVAASSISPYTTPSHLRISSENVFDFWSICTGLTYLYTRPWFERIWVQQEIFAARKLRLQCGNLQFEWSNLLSQPTLLSMLPHLQPYSKLAQDEKEYKKLTTKIPDEINAQFNAISTLNQLHKYNLNCFEQFSGHKPDSQERLLETSVFSKKGRQKPDFIEALLDTGGLHATNSLDYIYGIVGMTEFPAKAMTVQEWTIARQHEVFIPIDYSANLTSILCAVTWAALMKGGLAVIAKFKAFTTQDDDNACEHPLPSWVIDWRLAARLFRRRANIWSMGSGLTLENAWAKLLRDGHLGLVPGPPPASQEQFCQDNRDSTVPYTKLILRGVVYPALRAEGNCIWDNGRGLKNKVVWQLECDVYPTDLVVDILGFSYGLADIQFRLHVNKGAAPSCYEGGGLWLLRPAGDDEFKFVASLSFVSGEIPKLYSRWEWNPGYFREAPSQGQLVDHCRRFATDPKNQTVYLWT